MGNCVYLGAIPTKEKAIKPEASKKAKWSLAALGDVKDHSWRSSDS